MTVRTKCAPSAPRGDSAERTEAGDGATVALVMIDSFVVASDAEPETTSAAKESDRSRDQRGSGFHRIYEYISEFLTRPIQTIGVKEDTEHNKQGS